MTATPTAPAPTTPLVGAELLAKIKQIGQAPRDHVVIACGYVRKDGKPAYTAFYEAHMAAHGLALQPPTKPAKAGKPLSFRAKVTKAGMVPIGAAYCSLISAGEGDTITIEHLGDTLVLRKEVNEVVETTEPAACPAPVPAASASVDPGEESDDDEGELEITAPF